MPGWTSLARRWSTRALRLSRVLGLSVLRRPPLALWRFGPRWTSGVWRLAGLLRRSRPLMSTGWLRRGRALLGEFPAARISAALRWPALRRNPLRRGHVVGLPRLSVLAGRWARPLRLGRIALLTGMRSRPLRWWRRHPTARSGRFGRTADARHPRRRTAMGIAGHLRLRMRSAFPRRRRRPAGRRSAGTVVRSLMSELIIVAHHASCASPGSGTRRLR